MTPAIERGWSISRLLFAMLLALASGCVSAPGGGDAAPKPHVVISDSHWSALADDVEAGAISDSVELVGVVKILHTAGKLEPASFNAAFPEFVKPVKFDATNKADVAMKLRGLK